MLDRMYFVLAATPNTKYPLCIYFSNNYSVHFLCDYKRCFSLQVIEDQLRVEKAREAELDMLYQ